MPLPPHSPKETLPASTSCVYLLGEKGTEEWWTMILTDPSFARAYWNVYWARVSAPLSSVK